VSSLHSFEIKIVFAAEKIGHLDDNISVLYLSSERGGIAATMDLIDTGRREPFATVVADHEVAFLGVAFVFQPADIAGIKGGADYTVGTLEDEVADDDTVLSLIGELMFFPISKYFFGMDDLVWRISLCRWG
jgi:hypothetical protein